MREGLTRLAPAVVLIAFAVPLFIGLGSFDLASDEAIYSYAVDSILSTGDWLAPRSSPHPDEVFLEKPHLKLWIVAAPIRLGLLPLNEFGLRFWDALFGAFSFFYVFLIGRRLAGWVCGTVAGLVLFAHEPLIFDHGFRSNNMDAALVLAYCGGVYHYLRWASASPGASRGAHIGAVLAFFYLGFMSKFVAALFLPAVLGLAALAVPAHRARLIEDRGRWTVSIAITIAAILPWFIYQHVQHGPEFWIVLLGEHVVTRLTTYVDPAHVQPWYFYAVESFRQFQRSGSAIWIGVGLAILLVNVLRRRTPDGVVVLLWATLPSIAISFGNSKLYHYFYPFLPPLAIAAGYGVAVISRAVAQFVPRRNSERRWATPRAYVAGAIVLLSIGFIVATAATGTLQIYAGDQLLFRNSSLLRPAILGLAGLALIDLRAAIGCAAVLALSTVFLTPVTAYPRNLARLAIEHRPLASIADCVHRIDEHREQSGFVPGAYGPVSDAFLHQYFFYFRGTGWVSPEVDDSQLRTALFVSGQERVVIIDNAAYSAFLERTADAGPLPAAITHQRALVLLPGAYRECRGS
ncbi:MAG TPA: glycosyltransferase family 39 protein [Vicinamibacterales bacterium]